MADLNLTANVHQVLL